MQARRNRFAISLWLRKGRDTAGMRAFLCTMPKPQTDSYKYSYTGKKLQQNFRLTRWFRPAFRMECDETSQDIGEYGQYT